MPNKEKLFVVLPNREVLLSLFVLLFPNNPVELLMFPNNPPPELLLNKLPLLFPNRLPEGPLDENNDPLLSLLFENNVY